MADTSSTVWRTVKQICDEFSIGKTTVYDFLKKGLIRGSKVPGIKQMVDVESVRALLDRHAKGGVAPSGEEDEERSSSRRGKKRTSNGKMELW